MSAPHKNAQTVAGGAVFAFGSFSVSNIQLRSSFLWYIGMLFVGTDALAWMPLSREPRG